MATAIVREYFSRLSRLGSKMMDACIFCKIVAGQVNAEILHRDDQVTAFRDLHPVAPTHILIVPNRHIESVNGLLPSDEALVGHMVIVAGQLANREKIHEDGFRLIMNTGPHGGQTVFHMHLHLIGGQRMKHPMG